MPTRKNLLCMRCKGSDAIKVLFFHAIYCRKKKINSTLSCGERQINGSFSNLPPARTETGIFFPFNSRCETSKIDQQIFDNESYTFKPGMIQG